MFVWARWVLLGVVAAASTSIAQPQAQPVVAVMSLDSNKTAAEAAPAVSALIASRLADSQKLKVISDRDVAAAIGAERQRQLMGVCEEDSCLPELSGALGARYLVTGRLDRLGERFMLAVSVFDSQAGVSIVKPRDEASDEEGLSRAAGRVAQEILVALGAVPPRGANASELALREGVGFTLGVKLGNQFLASLAALNPGAELEFGWAFDPEWLAFLQVGFNLVRGEQSGQAVSLTVLPSVLGVRKLYRVAESLRPYWGMGMGLQLSIGQFGPIKETESFPTVVGMLGCQYRLTRHLDALAEASINLAQLVLGLRYNRSLGEGLNFDLSLGVVYRF